MATLTDSFAVLFHPTSPSLRIWTALGPAILLMAYFILGLVVYVGRIALFGQFRDPELEKRDRTILTGLWIRLYFVWVTQPLWRFVLRTGLPANAITTLSLLLAFGSGIGLAAGHFALGGWLYIFSGVCDYLDGRLARLRGDSSPAGAALDSILDRYSDAAVMAGLCWYYRDSWVLAPAILALTGASFVPYIRARAEASGLKMTSGLMQRAERILYLGTSTAISPVLEATLAPDNAHPIHRLAIAGIVLLAVSTQLTAFQRFISLLQALSAGQKNLDSPSSTQSQLFRNLTAAVVATGLDFSVVALLVRHDICSAPVATAMGCAFGAALNFVINRMWTFDSQHAALPQMGRYGFVSFTSALLNSSGVALLLLLPDVDYRIAWVLARAAVFFAWNFPLHRNYVFTEEARG